MNILKTLAFIALLLSVIPSGVRAEEQAKLFVAVLGDKLTISGLKQNGTILLFNAEGKLLQQQTVAAQTITMDMSSCAKGIYLLQYQAEGEVVNQKIIKQ